MKRLPIFLITVTLLLTAIPVSPIETAQSDAPYIQYYSPDHNAFIIERADGTDSRLFGGEWIPEGTTRVAGAGWSPSGEWFGFMAMHFTRSYRYEGLRTIAIDPSGTNHLSVLDELEHTADFMEWFPAEDKLLVSTIAEVPDTNHYERFVYVIDADTDTITTSFNVITDKIYPEISWNARHRKYLVRFYDYDQSGEWIALVSSDGKFEHFGPDFYVERISDEGWYFKREERRNFAINIFDDRRIEVPSLTDLIDIQEPFVVYRVAEGMRLLHLDSEEIISVPPDLTTNYLPEMLSPDGRGLIMWNEAEDAFLLDTSTGEILDLDTKIDTFPLEVGLEHFKWDSQGRLLIPDHTEIVSTVTIVDDDQQRTIELPMDTLYSIVSMSEDGQWVASVLQGTTTHNLTTGETFLHQPPSGAYYSIFGGRIIWHPHSDWLISARVSFVSDGDDGSRFINVATPDGTVNRELTFCVEYDDVCASWLPEQVDVSDLPEFRDNLHSPEPIPPHMTFFVGDFVGRMVWSADGNYLMADEAYSAETSYIYIHTGQLIEQLPEDTLLDQQWRDCTTQQTDEFIFRPTGDFTIAVVDVSTDTELVELEIYGCAVTGFTPDRRYVLHNSRYAEKEIGSNLCKESKAVRKALI